MTSDNYRFIMFNLSRVSFQSVSLPLWRAAAGESAGDSYLRMRCRRQLPKGLAVTQEINIISFQIQAAGQIYVTHARAGRGVSLSLSLFEFSAHAAKVMEKRMQILAKGRVRF